MLTAVQAGSQPPQQPLPVLPQTISSGFAGSAFGPAAVLPLDMVSGCVQRPVVNSGERLCCPFICSCTVFRCIFTCTALFRTSLPPTQLHAPGWPLLVAQKASNRAG